MSTRTKKPAAASDAAPANEYLVSGTKVTADTPVSYAANPKRPNSAAWERYEHYQSASTFGEYLELNEGKFAMADARHDLGKGFLKIAE